MRSGGGVDLRTMAVFSSSGPPTGAPRPGLSGTYGYVPRKIRVISGRASAAMAVSHCPGTFQGEGLLQVTLFDGSPGEQVVARPMQEDAAEIARTPVARSDR